MAMQQRETPTQVGGPRLSAEVQPFQYQIGFVTVAAAGQGARHANRVGCGEFAQAVGLGLEHTQVCIPVQLGKKMPPVPAQKGINLMNAATGQRRGVHAIKGTAAGRGDGPRQVGL